MKRLVEMAAAVVLTAFAVMAFALPAAAMQPTALVIPGGWHRLVLRAPARWESARTYHGNIETRFYVDGHQLLFGEQVSGCRTRQYGYGLIAQTTACGRRFRLAITLQALGHPRVVVRWRAKS